MNSVRLVRLESKIIKSKIYMSFLRSIMFVGTCSDAGKSIINTEIGRAHV